MNIALPFTAFVATLASGARESSAAPNVEAAGYAVDTEKVVIAKEDWAPSASLALGAVASIAGESGKLGGIEALAGATVRLRSLAGSSLGYCAGFDGMLGGSPEGVAYDTSAYLLGAGLRLGKASYVAACAGAGLSGAAGAIPFAWQFPAELSAEVQAGPVRVALWGKVLWTSGADARSEGSRTASFADELEVGASVRLGRPTRYWRSRTTSHSYFIGVQYRELMDTHLLGLIAGVGFWGGR